MRKKITLLLLVIGSFLNAQEFINYQAAIRDGSGDLIVNTFIGVQFSILQSISTGSVSYSETHAVNTNSFGMVNIELGNGTPSTGQFGGINWAAYNHFLKVEVNTGSGYVHMGTSPMNYVPYAHYAAIAEQAVNDNDNQTLLLEDITLSISNGNAVNLPAETALWNANKLKGNNISTLAPSIYDVLKWTGTSWAPGTDEGTTYLMGSGLSLSGNYINSSWTYNGDHVFSNNSGHVGIGTMSPTSPLHVKGLDGLDPLHVQVGGATKLMVHSNGGLGIGYSNSTPPADGLLVDGDIAVGLTAPQNRVHITSATSTSGCLIRLTRGTTGMTSSDGLLLGYSSNGINYIWGYENNDLVFGANGEQRMTLENDGDLGIGTANPSYDLQLGYNSAAKPISSAWTVYSDSRLKNEVSSFEDGLDLVMQIRPIVFKYNGKIGLPTDETGVGTMAQELQQIAPYMVHSFEYTEKSAAGPEEPITTSGRTEEYLAVDYGAMDFVLVNAIKELKQMVDDQQGLIQELQSKVQSLENGN